MAVESNVADSSETVVVLPSTIMNNNRHPAGTNSEQASPDSSCVDEQGADRQQETITNDQTESNHRRQSSVIRLIRPELLMKEEHGNDQMAPPRIDVIVNPSHQFQPEFRPMLQQQRRLTNNNNNIKRSTNNHSVVSSSTSPGPSNRMTPPPPPLPSSRHNPAIVMGPPPPPPAQPALLPKSGANKSPPGQRIRKSTAGTQRRHPASPPDHEEPSSSIPEIGKSNNF